MGFTFLTPDVVRVKVGRDDGAAAVEAVPVSMAAETAVKRPVFDFGTLDCKVWYYTLLESRRYNWPICVF